MLALTTVGSPPTRTLMTKLLTIAIASVLSMSLPLVARAGSVALFPDLAFTPVPAGTSNGGGAAGFWDNRSYDSWIQSNGIASSCTAGAIVFGGGCDWRGLPQGSPQLTNPRVGNGNAMQYLGTADGSIPDDFSFTGPWALDFAVLFQLTAWDDTVEFGWYEAGNPNNRTSLLPRLGLPPGPYSDNLGGISPNGTVSAEIPGNFGFYYRNTRYGEGPGREFTFFTESRFNDLGGYFNYFRDRASGIDLSIQLLDDESDFLALFDLINRQQFALFTDGSGRYWLGLEDQLGRLTGAFCQNLGDRLAPGLTGTGSMQPCSDYDYNDLILSITANDVPEPTTLTLLGAGFLAIARLRRRAR